MLKRRKLFGQTTGGFGYERPMRESRMERPQERYSQDTVQIQVEPTVTKSRRIEERKQSVVQSKLNKILFWIIVLLIALIIAIWRL